MLQECQVQTHSVWFRIPFSSLSAVLKRFAFNSSWTLERHIFFSPGACHRFHMISRTWRCQHSLEIMFSAYMKKMSHHPPRGAPYVPNQRNPPPFSKPWASWPPGCSVPAGAEDEGVDRCSVVRQSNENRHNKHNTLEDAPRREAATASARPIRKPWSIGSRHNPSSQRCRWRVVGGSRMMFIKSESLCWR